MNDRVSISISDGIADVKMIRADKRNALDGAMFAGLVEAGERLKSERGVRVVVLSGEGSSFCAGLDFSSFQSMAGGGGVGGGEGAGGGGDGERGDGGDGERAGNGGGNPSAMQEGRITHLGQQAAWVWQELAVPVIAAVHGHALGGGIQIALGADFRIVHPDTQLSVREVHWGLVPDMTGTLLLAQLVRPDIVKDLVFTARVFDGREAHAIGVATKLSETPYDDAMAMAREIAGRSPDAVRGAKALLNGLLHTQAATQFAEERRIIGSLIGSPNQKEAVVANFEKRAPAFVDA